MPHGLVNIRYLRRRPGPLVEWHRSLWLDALPGWPRPLALLVEANLWLRWTIFGAWLATWLAVRRRGRTARFDDGVSLARQSLRVLGLALRWGIPPAQAYRFGLHVPPGRDRRGDRDPALQYVFAAEAAAWHRRANAGDPGRARAVALLQDKSALAASLSPAGIAMVETRAAWSPGEPTDLAAWLAARMPSDAAAWPGLFFKTREGMGGLGAFAAWQRGGEWEGAALDGQVVQGLAAIQAMWDLLVARGAVLVQPRLVTHAQLAGLAATDDAVTVRVITRRWNGRGSVAMAIVEAPRGRGLHALWPVDPIDGTLRTRTWDGHEANPAPASGLLAATAPEPGLRVPDWERMARQSGEAHDAVGALSMIAWDWIVTPEGARLLEGNSGWALMPPQRLFGPAGSPDQAAAWGARFDTPPS